ncbi:hypothetical protein ABW20_dc0110659 [Dactylellina cionopaga]|nr:hypothetical protein ABW20_dc0110659 [Dactylellina cionopaga]
MKFTTLTGTLLAVGSVSANWCDYPVLHSSESCATQYGNKQVYNVPRATSTVYSSTKVTVTKTEKPTTCTVTAKDQTVTKEVTTTCTSTKQCRVNTIYVTKVYTSTLTIPQVKTESVCVTKTVAGAPHVIPTPYGFIYVSDDPDNQNKPYKRGNYGNYGGYQSYPTAVKCTKTVDSKCTVTVIKKGPQVTVTVPGKTKTVTHTNTITKTVCGNPTVTTKTVASTCTVTTTKKSTKTVTWTKTATVPGPTTYAACNARNIYTGPSGSVSVTSSSADKQVPAKDAYDCCVQCQLHSSYGAKDCAGSYFVSNKCYLRITNKCPSQSGCKEWFKSGSQSYGSYGNSGSVSNGNCGRWKWQH